MASVQPVRGTHDLLPEQKRRHNHVETMARDIAALYGFAEMSTPIIEFTEVFSRTLGETSDVVTKEMYSFSRGDGESLTLRPEGTAGVCRAVISNGLTQQMPFKVFYRGPMFRYERPQKGRQRQFNQVGVELLGVASPQADIEIIALGAQVLDSLGLGGKVALEINTLGDNDSRDAYRAKLVDYLKGSEGKLSPDSRARLERNPMRVLDSKDEGDKAIVEGAPVMTDSLNDVSRKFFDELLAGLDAIGVVYTVNPHIVRGLDYYCHTAFEFVTTELGAQGTVLAGGRYDGLVKQMGGPPTPGTGWAAGVERLAMLIDEPVQSVRPVAIIPVGEVAANEALVLAQTLRRSGFTVELGYSGNLGRRMNRANKLKAIATVILGEDELARGAASVRNMDTGEQVEVPLKSLETHLAAYW
jgi:histidyl-tRNA synthetase